MFSFFRQRVQSTGEVVSNIPDKRRTFLMTTRELFLTPPPCMRFAGWKMASTLRNILMLARRSCHWGPIIALSLVTIVTTSSTYCLFQLSVLPNVVVFKSVHNIVCYSWIALILKNFFQVCACYFFISVCIYYIVRVSYIISSLRVVLKASCW